VDAAGDALMPVWELAPAYRRHSLVERLSTVARVLGEPRFAGAVEAGDLAGRVEAFAADSAPRSLAQGGPETVPLPGTE
jgi:hypothetical protein